jgi:hypothetical protein
LHINSIIGDIYMKTLKSLSLLIIVMTFTASFSFGETLVFDGSSGLTGWDYVGSGTAYDADNGNLESPFKDLVNLLSPANTNNYGLGDGAWGWDAAKFEPHGHILPNSGAYTALRYEAPAGQVITDVVIDELYLNVDPNMTVQIADADGNIAAQVTRGTPTEMITGFSAVELNTPSIEIRWVNTAASTIHIWGSTNGVIIKSIELATIDDPNYDPFDPITYENPNKPSTWFGYYHAHTDVNNWGDAFPEVGSYTNLNYVFPSVAAVQSAAANHSYMLVDVMWHLFNQVGQNTFELLSNWQDNVNGLKVMFEGNEQYIGAITPLDEPYHRNVSQADLEAAIAALKEAFPGIPVYVNFAPTIAPNLTAETLPAGADWLAFDLYESDGQPVQITDIQAIVNHLKSIKLPEQKLFLVPPSAMNLVADYTDQQLADTINAFYSLMQSDDEIIGMMAFPADGCRQAVFDGAGSTIPLALAAQQAIGAEIAGEVCGDVWNGLYKFDYNGDCHVDFADWAGYALRWVME